MELTEGEKLKFSEYCRQESALSTQVGNRMAHADTDFGMKLRNRARLRKTAYAFVAHEIELLKDK